MASDSRRTSPRNWLFAALFSGTFLLPLGAVSATPSLGPVAALHASSASASGDHLTGYGRPHPVFVATPQATVASVAAPAPVAAEPAANRARAPRRVVAHAAPRPAPAPAHYRNRLVSGDGTLNTGVGYYGDCSGRTPLTHSSAAIDTCVGGRTYFIGHNPGVFSPLFHMGVGSIITWYDGAGNVHRLRIIGVRTWRSANGVPGLMGGATAEFQTCITADGSVDRIMDAAPA